MNAQLYGDDGAADDSYVHAYADSEPSPSRPFAVTDDGADTEEDELMRMIMEKERQEAEAEAKAATQAAKYSGRGRKEQRLQVPSRTVRPTAVQISDDFYSPVRPADSNGSSTTEQHRGHAPFRGARVVTESHRYKQRASPVYSEQRERQAKFVNFHGHDRSHNDDVTSNQAEHDVPPQQNSTSTSEQRMRDKKVRERMQDPDDVWDLFLHGTSGDDNASSTSAAAAGARHPKPSASAAARDVAKRQQKNIFREEISISQSRSTSLDSGFTTANESTANTFKRQQQQEGSSAQPSGSFSNESIPNVSYSPPMSPATSSSQGSSNHWRHSEDHFESRLPLSSLSPAVFPFWSVAFLLSCVAVGVSGFFIEEVMDLVGRFSKSASSLSLSKYEQKQMHTRLEQLQSEIHGFRYTASEIEIHSQRVFAEVKAHLGRMKSEREKHQEMIAHEMNDLRAYMLHMMSDMVEQERELIHTRLKHVAAVEESKTAFQEVDVRVESALHDTEPASSVETSEGIQPVDQPEPPAEQPVNQPPVVDVSTVIEIVTQPAVEVLQVQTENASPSFEPGPSAPAPTAAALSRGEGVMLLSWELLLMLAAMSILGGLVGLRVRNINRRKRWFEHRRIQRQIRATLEQERAEREAEETEAEDEDDSEELDDDEEEETEGEEIGDDDTNSEEDWDDGATESSSIETVSLLRRATGLTPLGKMQAPSTDDEDSGDDEEEEAENGDEEQAQDSPERKKVRFQLKSCASSAVSGLKLVG